MALWRLTGLPCARMTLDERPDRFAGRENSPRRNFLRDGIFFCAGSDCCDSAAGERYGIA